MLMTQRPILVIGHHNPDTDAVCSALAYAHFHQWQTGQPTVACYLDEMAPETLWLLGELGLQAPRQISDVYLRVADVMDSEVPVLHPQQTLREAGLLMQQHQIRALPVVDQQRLVGLVQNDTLAARYLDQLQLPEEINLPVALIVRTLSAELLVGSQQGALNDRVWITTMTGEAARRMIGNGDVVIVGDQLELQHAALDAGSSCLILTDNAPLDAEVQQRATEQSALVLRTQHSPFAAALLLIQSIPVERVMSPDLPAVTVHRDTLLHEARAQLRRGNLSGLAVIDDHTLFCGLLRRRNLAEQANHQVILTDHNHPDQAAAGVSESQIIAIIDHHNLGGLQTLQPLYVQCDPVGSTCTLIAERYQQMNAPLPPALAGAMLGAILSDTVQFRSPTTTPRDRQIAAWLAEQSGQQIERLAHGLFRARLPNPIPSVEWWINRDFKVFSFGDTRFSISQVELAGVAEVMPAVEVAQAALAALAAERHLTSAYLLLTDILEERSLLIAANAEGEALAERAFGSSFSAGKLLLPGVMSRKKQVVPPLAEAAARG
jgi:manganese-dependent inorganic pyrophosphatase